jgi:phage terminase large subunit-like protein
VLNKQDFPDLLLVRKVRAEFYDVVYYLRVPASDFYFRGLKTMVPNLFLIVVPYSSILGARD